LIKEFAGKGEIHIQVVDRNHGSALAAWEAMGKPAFPSREQQDSLRKAAELGPPEIRALPETRPATLSLTLEPDSLTIVEVLHHSER
jgi:xylan 1,4-beta-xylosidase